MITKESVKNPNLVPLITRMRKSTYLVQPSGFSSDVTSDFWIHMEFQFNPDKSDVEVKGWWVTDAFGAQISLSRLSYLEFQFIAEAMAEESQYHHDVYYFEIESAYYSGGF
jgi:hypothetical protein